MKCLDCKTNEGDKKYIDADSAFSLAFTHSDFVMLCDDCMTKRALEFCETCAKRIPELKAKLKKK